MDAHENFLLKGWRKWSDNVEQNGEYGGKGRSCRPYPPINFLRFLLRPLGQEPHQHQVTRCIPSVHVLQSARLGVILFFCLDFRTSPSILTTISNIEHPCSFVASIVLQNLLRGAVVTSSPTKASRSALLVVASTYREYSLPLRPGHIASTPGDCCLRSLVASQLHQAC